MSLPIAANAQNRDHQGRSGSGTNRSVHVTRTRSSGGHRTGGTTFRQERTPTRTNFQRSSSGYQRSTYNLRTGTSGTSFSRSDQTRRIGDFRDHHFFRSDHDDWRDILFIGGIIDFGILLSDATVCFDGDYGAYYPVWELDIDLYGSNPELRARAELFDRPFFYRNGYRYTRRTVIHDGERCYQFVRD